MASWGGWLIAGRDRSQLRAYGLVAGAGTLWGTMGVMAKFLYADGVSPWSLAFLRALLGCVACGLVIVAVDRSWLRIRRSDLPFFAIYGLLSTSAFFFLYLYTISLTTVAVAVVLLYTSPVFSALLGRLFLGESMSATKAAALALAFVGCILVTGLEAGQLAVSTLGLVTGLSSGLTYAFFGIMGKHARRRYGPVTILFYSMGFGSLFLLPILLLPEAPMGPFSGQSWALIGVMAVGPTLIARILFVAAVKHVEASRAAIIATIEPLVATILAALLLSELLSPSQVVGGVLVLAGSVLAQHPGRRPLSDVRTAAVVPHPLREE